MLIITDFLFSPNIKCVCLQKGCRPLFLSLFSISLSSLSLLYPLVMITSYPTSQQGLLCVSQRVRVASKNPNIQYIHITALHTILHLNVFVIYFLCVIFALYMNVHV